LTQKAHKFWVTLECLPLAMVLASDEIVFGPGLRKGDTTPKDSAGY